MSAPSTAPPPTVSPQVKRRGRMRSPLSRSGPLTYLVAYGLVGICLGPVLYIILGGFRTNSQITVNPSGFPNPWEVGNYISVLESSLFWRQLGNSTIVAVLTTLGVVVLGVMASNVLARYSFTGRGVMYSLFAAGL